MAQQWHSQLSTKRNKNSSTQQVYVNAHNCWSRQKHNPPEDSHIKFLEPVCGRTFEYVKDLQRKTFFWLTSVGPEGKPMYLGERGSVGVWGDVQKRRQRGDEGKGCIRDWHYHQRRQQGMGASRRNTDQQHLPLRLLIFRPWKHTFLLFLSHQLRRNLSQQSKETNTANTCICNSQKVETIHQLTNE